MVGRLGLRCDRSIRWEGSVAGVWGHCSHYVCSQEAESDDNSKPWDGAVHIPSPPHLNLSINPPSEICPEVCLLGILNSVTRTMRMTYPGQSEAVIEKWNIIKMSSLTKALEIRKTPSPTSACESLNYEWSWTQNISVLHWETELAIRRSRFFCAFVVWT